MKLFTICSLLLSFFILGSTTANAYDILVPKRLNSDVIQSYYSEVLGKMYKEIGVDVKFKAIYEKEINTALKGGDFDSIGNKISYGIPLAHSLQISTPTLKYYKVNVWRLRDHKLSNKKLKVAGIRGVRAHEKAVINNKDRFSKVLYVNTYFELMQLLVTKQVEGILLSEVAVLTQLPNYFAKELTIHWANIYVTSIHHYIHVKHKNILPKLEAKFKEYDKKNLLEYKVFLRKYLREKEEKEKLAKKANKKSKK
jgi:hypothetical protein